jgi:hypothetical protein
MLQIPRPTITKYIRYLRQQDRGEPPEPCTGTLPQEYEKCMSGINRVLQLTWEIAEIPTEDKTRLQALLNLTKVTSSKWT